MESETAGEFVEDKPKKRGVGRPRKDGKPTIKRDPREVVRCKSRYNWVRKTRDYVKLVTKGEGAPCKIWSIAEKKRLLEGLSQYSHQDWDSLCKQVPSRTKEEIQDYIHRLKGGEQYKDKATAVPLSWAPIESWSDLGAEMVHYEQEDVSSIVTRVFTIIGHFSSADNAPGPFAVDYGKLYRYLAAVMDEGLSMPELTPLESAIIVDLMHGLGDKLRMSDVCLQRKVMCWKYKMLNHKFDFDDVRLALDRIRSALTNDFSDLMKEGNRSSTALPSLDHNYSNSTATSATPTNILTPRSTDFSADQNLQKGSSGGSSSLPSLNRNNTSTPVGPTSTNILIPPSTVFSDPQKESSKSSSSLPSLDPNSSKTTPTPVRPTLTNILIPPSTDFSDLIKEGNRSSSSLPSLDHNYSNTSPTSASPTNILISPSLPSQHVDTVPVVPSTSGNVDCGQPSDVSSKNGSVDTMEENAPPRGRGRRRTCEWRRPIEKPRLFTMNPFCVPIRLLRLKDLPACPLPSTSVAEPRVLGSRQQTLSATSCSTDQSSMSEVGGTQSSTAGGKLGTSFPKLAKGSDSIRQVTGLFLPTVPRKHRKKSDSAPYIVNTSSSDGKTGSSVPPVKTQVSSNTMNAITAALAKKQIPACSPQSQQSVGGVGGATMQAFRCTPSKDGQMVLTPITVALRKEAPIPPPKIFPQPQAQLTGQAGFVNLSLNLSPSKYKSPLCAPVAASSVSVGTSDTAYTQEEESEDLPRRGLSYRRNIELQASQRGKVQKSAGDKQIPEQRKQKPTHTSQQQPATKSCSDSHRKGHGFRFEQMGRNGADVPLAQSASCTTSTAKVSSVECKKNSHGQNHGQVQQASSCRNTKTLSDAEMDTDTSSAPISKKRKSWEVIESCEKADGKRIKRFNSEPQESVCKVDRGSNATSRRKSQSEGLEPGICPSQSSEDSFHQSQQTASQSGEENRQPQEEAGKETETEAMKKGKKPETETATVTAQKSKNQEARQEIVTETMKKSRKPATVTVTQVVNKEVSQRAQLVPSEEDANRGTGRQSGVQTAAGKLERKQAVRRRTAKKAISKPQLPTAKSPDRGTGSVNSASEERGTAVKQNIAKIVVSPSGHHHSETQQRGYVATKTVHLEERRDVSVQRCEGPKGVTSSISAGSSSAGQTKPATGQSQVTSFSSGEQPRTVVGCLSSAQSGSPTSSCDNDSPSAVSTGQSTAGQPYNRKRSSDLSSPSDRSKLAKVSMRNVLADVAPPRSVSAANSKPGSQKTNVETVSAKSSPALPKPDKAKLKKGSVSQSKANAQPKAGPAPAARKRGRPRKEGSALTCYQVTYTKAKRRPANFLDAEDISNMKIEYVTPDDARQRMQSLLGSPISTAGHVVRKQNTTKENKKESARMMMNNEEISLVTI